MRKWRLMWVLCQTNGLLSLQKDLQSEKKGQFPLEKNQTPLYEINLKSLETQTHLCTVLKMAMCIIPLELESQAKSHPSPLSNDQQPLTKDQNYISTCFFPCVHLNEEVPTQNPIRGVKSGKVNLMVV